METQNTKYELTDEEKEALGRAKKEEWKEILRALAILQQTPDEDYPKALQSFVESFPKFAGKLGSRLEVARKMNAIIDDRLHDLIEAEAKKQREDKK
ncbi:MAG: hypothetical protein LUD39_02510 [Opitutae bacterium]|nr:hypothetical protein [Opitutae bacterium]